MKSIRQLSRIIYINFVLIRNGLDEVALSVPLFTPIRFLAYLNPWNWSATKNIPRGVRIRCVLEQLGPVFVKFGQVLSTRVDLLPDDIAIELAKLQDQVPPFPEELAITIIENELHLPIQQLFATFESKPLASASIAQVHAATLFDGKEVIIKVLRPNIEKTIRQDIALLYTLANLAQRYWSHGQRLRPKEIVAEFERTILDELDFLREASNAAQLRRNFLNSPLLYIPEIHWRMTTSKVMVQERIYGIPVADRNALLEYGVNLKNLAENGVEIFFTQVFRDCFFHADMHPGNIFVNPAKPNDPQYIAVDFGIIGTLSPIDQRYLAENFLAFFNRDYQRVALLHIESGWIPADTRIDEFESAMRTVCEPIFERPLKEISLSQMFSRLLQTGQRFNMQTQPQLVLLQKTLFNIEGLGRSIYPDLDIWAKGKPFLEKWVQKQFNLRVMAKNFQKQWPSMLESLPALPNMLYETLKVVKNAHLKDEQALVKDKKYQRELQGRFWFGFSMGLVVLGVLLFIKEVIEKLI